MYDVRPAGFWIRAIALVIDVAILMFVEHSLGLVAAVVWGASVEESAPLQFMTFVFTLGFAALYVTLLHAGTGQTIGKMFVRAHVVLVDGEPVPVGTALLRFFAYFVSCLTLGFGYLMAALRHDKRALHDVIAGTRVERRLPVRATAPPEPPEAVGPPSPEVETPPPPEAVTPPRSEAVTPPVA
jgi:uncharacterized RDD family membrane protein YckC